MRVSRLCISVWAVCSSMFWHDCGARIRSLFSCRSLERLLSISSSSLARHFRHFKAISPRFSSNLEPLESVWA
ncbi:hypothetical protein FOQG_16715 [Fusarium oxysporum f. sp. raphani 54005]|uniref:Secreted protein n=1 Tax=Fusarium oxysporum f. sp. raphani 54005 TaxID=1089458 RepID=X0B8W6_FUSOX|nr:hypothetical protein FOQG_16715 [Fusarium oxysporum f. sp. raphani 54005]